MALIRPKSAQSNSSVDKTPAPVRKKSDTGIGYKGIVRIMKLSAVIFIIACIWLAMRSGHKEKTEVLDRLPGVKSLAIVTNDPLCVRVAVSESTGGAFIRKRNQPQEIRYLLDVPVGVTFAVHDGRNGYNFTLQGAQNEILEFSTTMVEGRGLPQTKIQLVKPYMRSN